MVMLVLASMLVGAFIFYSVLLEDPPDDNDDMDGGMMIPAQNQA
jgi:hypothetical protein